MYDFAEFSSYQQALAASGVELTTLLVDLPGACEVDFTRTPDCVVRAGDIVTKYPYDYPSSVTMTSMIDYIRSYYASVDVQVDSD